MLKIYNLEKCNNCYYVRTTKDNYGKIYKCCRFPPTFHKHGYNGMYPIVSYNDWCGEYKPKEN